MKKSNKYKCGVTPVFWERGTPTHSQSVALPKSIWMLSEKLANERGLKKSNIIQEIILKAFNWNDENSQSRQLNERLKEENIKNR